jgi:hypothetical protein
MENAQLESSESSLTALDNTSIPAQSSRHQEGEAARFRNFRDNSGSIPELSSSDISEPSSDFGEEQQTVANMQDAAAPVDDAPPTSQEQNLKLEQASPREQARKKTYRRCRSFKQATKEQESWASLRMRANEFTTKLTSSYRRSQLQRNASVPTFSSNSLSNSVEDYIGPPQINEQNNTMHNRQNGSVDGDKTIVNSFRPSSIDKRAQLLALQSPPRCSLEDAIQGERKVGSLPSDSSRSSLNAASPRNALNEFLEDLVFNTENEDTKINTKIDVSSVDNRSGGRKSQGSVLDRHSSAKSVSSIPTTMMRYDNTDTPNLQTLLKATKSSEHTRTGANTVTGHQDLSRKQNPDAKKSIGTSAPSDVLRGKDPPGKKKNIGASLETRLRSGQQNPTNTVLPGEQIEQQVTVTVLDDNDEKKYMVGHKEANIIQALMDTREVRKGSSSLVAPENSDCNTLHTKDETDGRTLAREVEGRRIISQNSSVHQSSKVSSDDLHGFLDRKRGGRSGAHMVAGDRVAVRFGNQDRSTKEVLELLEKDQSRPNKQSAVLWAHKKQLSARSLQMQESIQESIEASHESAPARMFEQDADNILDSARIGPRSINAGEKEEEIDLQDFLAPKATPAKEHQSEAITIPHDRVDFRALYAGERLLSLSSSRLNSRRNLALAEEFGKSGTTNRYNLMKKMRSVPTFGLSDQIESPESQTDLRLSGCLKRQGSSGSQLPRQRSAGEADSKLSKCLDKESSKSKKTQPTGGRASLAGDQLTLNRNSSLTREIYVRSDGKRVRRVRKSADGEILNKPESRMRTKSRGISGPKASQTESESKQNPKKTWRDQYLEGEVSHHDAATSPSPANKSDLSLKIGAAIEDGPSESRDSMQESSSEFDAPGTFNRCDGMRKIKSVPTMHDRAAAALVCLYDNKAASNTKHRPNACKSNETFDKTNSKTPPERRHSDYECISQASPRSYRSSKKLKDLPRQRVGKDDRPADSKRGKLLQNPNRLKKAQSCQNLGDRGYNVADRLMLMLERLQSLNNDLDITSLPLRPKVDIGDGNITPVKLTQEDCKEEAVYGKEQSVGSNEECILAKPQTFMSAVNTVDAQKLRDDNSGDEKAASDELQDEAASSAAPPPIPVRKISKRSQPTDASVVQVRMVLSATVTEGTPTRPKHTRWLSVPRDMVLSRTVTEGTPTRPKHTRWLSVPRDLGESLYSPARKLSATPQESEKDTTTGKVMSFPDPSATGINAAKKNPHLPFDSIHDTPPVEDNVRESEAIQSKVDDSFGPQVAAFQASRPPSIPLRKTSRMSENGGGNLLNSGERSEKKNPSRSVLQSEACRWSSVPKNLGSAVDTTTLKHKGSSNPRSKQSRKALNHSEIKPGSVLELEDDDTVCSELTDYWSADVIRKGLQAQANRHGRKASLDLDSILKEEGIDLLNNPREGLSFTPHEQNAPAVDDESILHQSKRWESSPGSVQRGVPRPKRPCEPEIPNRTKVQESSDRFGWLKNLSFARK